MVQIIKNCIFGKPVDPSIQEAQVAAIRSAIASAKKFNAANR